MFLIHVTYASGVIRTLSFPCALDRELFAIALRGLPVAVHMEDVVAS